jgi:hypothetical protein
MLTELMPDAVVPCLGVHSLFGKCTVPTLDGALRNGGDARARISCMEVLAKIYREACAWRFVASCDCVA